MKIVSVLKVASVILFVGGFLNYSEARTSKRHKHHKTAKHRKPASSKKQASHSSKKKHFKPAKHCNDPHIATTTAYFTPKMKDYCTGPSPCDKFMSDVNTQGSGRLPGNQIITHLRQIIPAGDCPTSYGSSGKCLTPYISVAANPCCYSMGDVIQMPALKGKEIRLPNGHIMIHPGYLIVEDIGGMIQGGSRFDMYTGTADMFDPDNIFGYKGSPSTRMIDSSECSARKAFTVIRRGNSDAYNSSRLAIDTSVRDSMKNMSIASAINTQGGSR